MRSARNARRTLLACTVLLGALALHAGPGEAKGKATYAKDLEALVKEVDKSYPFFDLKNIRKQWKAAKGDLAKRAKACKSDDEFLLIVFDAMKVLRDAHIQVEPKSGKYPEQPRRYFPGVGFLPASDGQVIVMQPPPGRETTLPVGTIVTKIDGKPAREVLEEQAQAAWDEGGWFSSPQRARLFAYRTPLAGEKGESHELTYLDERKTKTVKLRNEHELRDWPRAYNLPKSLKAAGKSIYYAKLESGVGYMWWRRIDESIWTGLPEALRAVPDAKGWIVDLRANTGGGYGNELLEGMKHLTRPVACVLDAGCISAGETAARDLVNLCKARMFGTRTAGSSSSKRSWTFPSGIATIRFSTRSRSGPDGRPIEFHGIAPDVEVEPDPAEVLAGKNTEILRAEAWVLGEGG